MTKKRIRITDGGIALPLGNNTFLMRGRLHSQGGIGIGNGSKNDIEVEDGEVVKFNKDNIQVLSDQPMLNGISPANALLAGGDFNKIFKVQQSINGNYGGSYAKDGSEKEIKKENIPTKEEYIAQKLDNIRNNALERSRNKTQDETTLVTEADVYGKKYVINRAEEIYNIASSIYNKRLKDKYEQYKKNNPLNSEIYTNIKDIENDEDLKRMYENLNNAKKTISDAKNGKYNGMELSNCIANLSEFYPHGLPYGNQTFKANPEKYGFSLIDTWDVEPGDLIQHINYGTPDHAMIYNGVDENGDHTFNYSSGDSPYIIDGNLYGGYGANKHYPEAVAKDGKHLWDVDVYRYTGTPQDSIQWSNEYDQKYGKTLKNGGQINMKLKNKNGNKQDITDIVMNEILPSSTGERKKFILGGSEWSLIGNAGLNLLSGLGQGIAGSINASKLRKMYDSLKRQSTFIPVAREHINTKVDVEPQLNLTAQTEYNLRRNAEMNTANAKVARSQARTATLDRIRQDNIIYSDKYNKENQLRNAEAELQTRYNLVDLENKLIDIREQNDFDMQKAIGKANAGTMEAQTWGNAIASTLGNTATSLMDYATMTNDLLKSNNPESYDNWFDKEFAHVNPKNFNNAEWLTKNQDWVTKYETQLLKRGLNKDWRNLIKG